MTDNYIDYQKALETTSTVYPPGQGFSSTSSISSETNKILISQNNLIIELLITINKKLDMINTSVQYANSFSTISMPQIEKLTTSIQNLTLENKGKKPIESVAPKTLIVWADPKQQIEDYRKQQQQKLS